jgi:hypothetical protein
MVNRDDQKEIQKGYIVNNFVISMKLIYYIIKVLTNIKNSLKKANKLIKGIPNPSICQPACLKSSIMGM